MALSPSESKQMRTGASISAVDPIVRESEFPLEDGTVLKVQPVVVSIHRVEGVDADGQPKYIAEFAFTLVKDCSRFKGA